jgi:hypothetical protein
MITTANSLLRESGMPNQRRGEAVYEPLWRQI